MSDVNAVNLERQMLEFERCHGKETTECQMKHSNGIIESFVVDIEVAG